MVSFKSIKKLLKELTFHGFNETIVPTDVYSDISQVQLAQNENLGEFKIRWPLIERLVRFTAILSDTPVLNPDVNLFIWAILTNKIEIAKLFWRKGEV